MENEAPILDQGISSGSYWALAVREHRCLIVGCVSVS